MPIHDRLWLTAVPKKTTDEVSAFLIIRASEARQYGFLFKGSLLRGSYDTFHWAADGEERAKLTTVQDGTPAATVGIKAGDVITKVGDTSVFSFCMCPGGHIVPAATERDGQVVNGWSPSSRRGRFANSGFVAEVGSAQLHALGLGRPIVVTELGFPTGQGATRDTAALARDLRASEGPPRKFPSTWPMR